MACDREVVAHMPRTLTWSRPQVVCHWRIAVSDQIFVVDYKNPVADDPNPVADEPQSGG